ncbi:hypothetical protein LINPERHAP1_LOCUS37825, partial [Linum perenne]
HRAIQSRREWSFEFLTTVAIVGRREAIILVFSLSLVQNTKHKNCC